MFVHGRLGPKLEDLLGEDRNFRTLVEEDYGEKGFKVNSFVGPPCRRIGPIFLLVCGI